MKNNFQNSKHLNWNDFLTRNADNLTSAFEDMCKAIFARKLGVKVADILEYKNQPGVECEPYIQDGDGWSFQSKFSDTKKIDFPAFKNSLIKAFKLKKHKREYENLTQVICYSNEDPIQKSSVRKKIESEALKLSITIDWYFGKRILERLEEHYYSDIRLRYFGGGQNLSLYLPNSSPKKNLSALKYQSSVTTFTGRVKELKSLVEFIDHKDDIIWWAISGAGATGKSRLAFEICQRYIDKGWCCGFYDKQQNNNELKNWQPEKPHLIIMDYASQENESPIALLKKVIELKKENKLNFPIRLLLIDRDAKATMQMIGQTPTYGEEIKNHLFKDAPLVIELIAEGDLKDIILDWAKFFKLSSSDIDIILNYVLKNSTERKILLAGLLCLKFYFKDSKLDDLGKSMKDLIGELIDSERAKYWIPFGLDNNKEDYLILATMSDGIQFDDISTFGTKAKEFIEDFDFPDIYGKIVGQPLSNRMGSLSHDLVSELYVLRSYNSSLPKDRNKFKDVIQLSLQIDGGQGLVSFFTRAAYDWRNHSTLEMLLQPFGEKQNEFIPWITLLSNIIDKINIPLLEKVQLFHDLVWDVAKGSTQLYNNLNHVFDSFFLRLLQEASQNNELDAWVRDYSVAVIGKTQVEQANHNFLVEQQYNTIKIPNTDLRLKLKIYCDTVIEALASVKPVVRAGLTWPGLDEIYRHAVLHRLVDRDADIKKVKQFISNMLSNFDVNWPVASIFRDAVAGMLQFGCHHKKKDGVLALVEYLIDDIKTRKNKHNLELFLSAVSSVYGHTGVSYDKKIELLSLWDAHFLKGVFINEQIGTQFIGFSVALMHNFRASSDLKIALQQMKRAEKVLKIFPNEQNVENFNLLLGQLIRREQELLSESDADKLLKKQISLVKAYGVRVPKIASMLISNISTLYSNAIKTDFKTAKKYFNIVIEISRYFSGKDIGSENFYLGEFLRGEFEFYLKEEDFESLRDLCDTASELQQFSFVNVEQFFLNTSSTLFSSYQAAVNVNNTLLTKDIALSAKYWLDNLYDKNLIKGIYFHIVNDYF